MKRASVRRAPKRRGRVRRSGAPQVSVREALRQFLTPQVFKQGHQAWHTTPYDCSWSLKAVLWVLIHMTWGTGDSEVERFLTARLAFVAEHQHGQRPGATWEGFQQALRRLPIPVFRALAAGLRQQVGRRWIDELRLGGWLPIGCDGARLECPRSAELEARLGQAGKDDSPPMVYVPALVLLPLGLLWAWRLDRGTGSELKHLRQMLPMLPEQSLLVADAFHLGYDWFHSIANSGTAFLVRTSSRAHLDTDRDVPLARFREGWVHYWPEHVQEQRRPPLRLLRVGGGQVDIGLLTNLDKHELPRRRAAQIYRWRWKNEGLFRTCKRTLNQLKLRHRTIALVFREAEGSLSALQLLMALAVQTMQQERQTSASPRQVLLRIRGEVVRSLAELGPRQLGWYQEALADLHGDHSRRTSSKTRRPWPRRKAHQPPKPPKFHRLSDHQKQLMAKTLQAP